MQFDIDIRKTVGARRLPLWKGLVGKSEARSFTLDTRIVSDVRHLVLAGPSGSGKSLTLQAVAGLLTPDYGRIALGGRVYFDSAAGINIPPRQRRVGYVFQDYALFPHYTVRQNVAFGLSRWTWRLGRERARTLDETLDVFGIRCLADSRPDELSGGQRQRVALARALVGRPDMLLLDEPFSALDQPLRIRMRKELARILEHFAIPMIMVTHDVDEAEYFAQTVVVYSGGTVHDVLCADILARQGDSVSRTVGNVLRSVYAYP